MKEPAQLFKALSDDTRMRIMCLLLEGELCVCDLMAILGLPQSTVSRHLAYLKNSGLVNDRRQGVWMHYRLTENDSAFHRDLINLLANHLPAIKQVQDDQELLHKHISGKGRNDCCER